MVIMLVVVGVLQVAFGLVMLFSRSGSSWLIRWVVWRDFAFRPKGPAISKERLAQEPPERIMFLRLVFGGSSLVLGIGLVWAGLNGGSF